MPTEAISALDLAYELASAYAQAPDFSKPSTYVLEPDRAKALVVSLARGHGVTVVQFKDQIPGDVADAIRVECASVYTMSEELKERLRVAMESQGQ